MKRSKQQKYRIKIIQELNLNKSEQKRLDTCISKGILTYELIYLNKNCTYILNWLVLKNKMNKILIDAMECVYDRISYSFKNIICERMERNNESNSSSR